MLVSVAQFARRSDPRIGRPKIQPVCPDWLEQQKTKWMQRHTSGGFEPFDDFETISMADVKLVMQRNGRADRKDSVRVSRPYAKRRAVAGRLSAASSNAIRDQVREWAEVRGLTLADAAGFIGMGRKEFYGYVNKYDVCMRIVIANQLMAMMAEPPVTA